MKLALLLLLPALLFAATPAASAPFAYAADGDTSGGNAKLYRIDLANNTLSEVGVLAGVEQLEALSFGPGGILYGYEDVNKRLVRINTATAAVTVIGSIGVAGDADDPGMAFCPDNQTMYLLTEQGNLYTINLSTAAATLVGNGGDYGPTGLSCDRSGVLYAVSDDTNSLYTVNRVNGASTLIGPLGKSISDAGLAHDGTRLLMVYDEGGTTRLWQLNTSTGAATPIATLITGTEISLESLALDIEAAPPVVQPIPTLSEWMMMLLAGLIGIVAFGSLRRRMY